MRTYWISLVSLLSLALAGCADSQTTVQDPRAPEPENTEMVSSVTTAVATSTVIATSGWLTYNNTQAGYSAKYPPDWTVNESVGINGELITTFMPPNDGQGITVIVRNGEPADQEIQDMPNTRCQQVMAGELSGTRCFDTIAFSTMTTFMSQGRVYILASSGKRLDQNIYQSFLSSFTVKS